MQFISRQATLWQRQKKKGDKLAVANPTISDSTTSSKNLKCQLCQSPHSAIDCLCIRRLCNEMQKNEENSLQASQTKAARGEPGQSFEASEDVSQHTTIGV